MENTQSRLKNGPKIAGPSSWNLYLFYLMMKKSLHMWLRILRYWNYPELSSWTLNAITVALIWHTPRGGGSTKTEQGDIWICWPWRWERCSHKPMVAYSHELTGRDKEQVLSYGLWRELSPAESRMSAWWLLAPRTDRQWISRVLSHPISGNFLQWPQKAKTVGIGWGKFPGYY